MQSFQSTHPQGVRLNQPGIPVKPCNFNPRTHKGCDALNDDVTDFISISIHAPTRGATDTHGLFRKVALISIHAPTRGATAAATDTVSTGWISIHAPTRGATMAMPSKSLNQKISIHAPTRGATRLSYKILHYIIISIHAPTRGATSILYKIPLLFYSYFTNFSFLSTENPTISSAPFYTRALFMQFFWCESPRDFLCTCNSHQQNPLIKSMSDPPQFLYLPRYVLLWFYTYFPDNKTSGCLCFHQ